MTFINESSIGVDRAFRPLEPLGPKSKDVTTKKLTQQELADQSKIENIASRIEEVIFDDLSYKNQIKAISHATGLNIKSTIRHIAHLAVTEKSLGAITLEQLHQSIPLSEVDLWLGGYRLSKQGAVASDVYEEVLQATAKAINL